MILAQKSTLLLPGQNIYSITDPLYTLSNHKQLGSRNREKQINVVKIIQKHQFQLWGNNVATANRADLMFWFSIQTSLHFSQVEEYADFYSTPQIF